MNRKQYVSADIKEAVNSDEFQAWFKKTYKTLATDYFQELEIATDFPDMWIPRVNTLLIEAATLARMELFTKSKRFKELGEEFSKYGYPLMQTASYAIDLFYVNNPDGNSPGLLNFAWDGIGEWMC